MVFIHATHKKSNRVCFTKEQCDGGPWWLKERLAKEKDPNWTDDKWTCKKVGDEFLCSKDDNGPTNEPDTWAEEMKECCRCNKETVTSQQITEIAKEIARTEKISLSRAYDVAIQRNPQLYRQYTEERNLTA